MFLENTPWKLPLDFHGVNFMEFSWYVTGKLMVYEKPLNGEFLMAHEKFLTTLITFSWYFYGPWNSPPS